MVQRKEVSGRETSRRYLRLFLVRHGQAGGEPRPGEVEAPLTSLGLRQAMRVARRLADKRFSHIYSSDMARACETAHAIRQYHADVSYTVTKDIREVSGHHIWLAPAPRTKEERELVVREREAVVRFVDCLLRSHHYGQTVLVVCHGNLMRLLVSCLAGLSPRESFAFSTFNTSVTILQVRHGLPLWLEAVNSVSHLPLGQVT